MNEKKCKDKVQEELNDRIEDLRKLWDAYTSGEEEVEDLGSIFDYGLAFDYVAPGTFTDKTQGYFRYQLSWGGPSDEFRFYTGPEFEPYSIEYWFLDWFDGASIELNGLRFNLLNEIFDWFKEGGTVQKVFEDAS